MKKALNRGKLIASGGLSGSPQPILQGAFSDLFNHIFFSLFCFCQKEEVKFTCSVETKHFCGAVSFWLLPCSFQLEMQITQIYSRVLC